MIAQPQIKPPFALSPIAGQIQVFTCVHRNFFTTVLAQALRHAGQGTAVLIIQFFKGGIDQGPHNPTHLSQNLDWVRCRLPGSINGAPEQAEERSAILELWEFAQDAIEGGRYEQVILDELSLAIFHGVIAEAEVQALLDHRPPHVDVIFLGQHMPTAIIQAADQVTNLRNLFNIPLEERPLGQVALKNLNIPPSDLPLEWLEPQSASHPLIPPSNVVPMRSKTVRPQPETKPERGLNLLQSRPQATECWVLPGQLQIPGID